MEGNFFRRPIFWSSLLLILLWIAVFSLPDQKLHLVFCDVGQGDAILVSYKQNQILIDGGPDNRVLSCLGHHLPFWDRKIEMIVLTHPEADHFTGLIDVIKRYSVNYFVSNNLTNDNPSFWELYRLVLEKKIQVYSPKIGEKIRIRPLSFLVLWPKETLGDKNIWLGNTFFAHEYAGLESSPVELEKASKFAQNDYLAKYVGDLNETSIVLKLSFGNFKTLLTGDLPSKFENQLDLTSVEVLKVAHHGSQTSTSQTFLEKLKPRLAIISVGKNNFGQPSPEILERLNNLKIRTLRTDQNGEIEIVSDGKRWYTRVHDSGPN